jgi:hypothetical protein
MPQSSKKTGTSGGGSRADQVRSAVDMAFQAAGAQLGRDRAIDLADELASAAQRVREALEELRPPSTDDLKRIARRLTAIEKRLGDLESAASSVAARRPGAARSSAAKRPSAAPKKPAAKKPAAKKPASARAAATKGASKPKPAPKPRAAAKPKAAARPNAKPAARKPSASRSTARRSPGGAGS